MREEIFEKIDAVLSQPKVALADDPVAREARRLRTITLNNSEIWKLGQFLGRNINTVDDILAAAKNVTTLKVKGLDRGEITLEPYLLDRLKSRCHPTANFPDFVREVVVKALMDYCGC